MALPSPKSLDAAFEVVLPSAPYPGLRPFNTDEWPIFFGREEMTDEVIARVIRQHLVVVHGDSGCGKSSLVRAGVLARLEQERARSGVSWRTAVMLPREVPLRRLAEAIAELQGAADDPDTLHQIRRILNRGADAPAALAELLCRGKDDHFCILIDQFEELFSFARDHDREEAELFTGILVGLQENPPPGLYAILTMRSEFLGHCARFKGLAEAVNRTQYLLPQMERPALLRAIREPATLYGGEVSRELAERLIADAGGHQDQLPLIQHGLMLLSRRKRPSPAPDEGREPYAFSGLAEAPARYEIDEAPDSYRPGAGPAWRLGLEDYRGGDLATLLSDHADQVVAAAAPDPRQEKLVEHLFRALTDINAEGQAIRRPQTMAELAAVTTGGDDEATLRDIIDRFRADGVSFLSPHGDKAVNSETQIDISHEALIRCWQRIADKKDGWLQHEFRDGLIWKATRLAAEDGDTLPALATSTRDAWLESLPSTQWCERYGGGWADVRQLMNRSRKAAEEEAKRKQELEEARRREAEERARRAEEAHRAAEAIAAKQQELRQAQERIAEEQKQRAEAERERATEAEAHAKEADAGRRRSRRAALAAGAFGLLAMGAALTAFLMWSQASRTKAEAQVGDSLYRAEQARKELRDGFPVTAMQLALAGLPANPEKPGARPWLGETGGALIEAMGAERELKVLRGHDQPVLAAGFSPDGARIVSGSGDKTVRVWDAASGKELLVLRGHDQPVTAAGFSPDGARIVSGSFDNTVRVWDAASGKELLVLRDDEGGVLAAGFSPDGARIVSGSGDKTVRVWDAASGKELLVLRGHDQPVTAAGFSPDGARIVSGSFDNTVRVWDAASGKELLVLRDHEGGVLAAGFSPDGARIVSGSGDHTVRVWDAASGKQLLVLRGHEGGVLAAGFSPDGARIVSGSGDHTVRVWDAASGKELLVLRGHEDAVHAAGFSPDGARIVSGSGDKTVRVWDAASGKELLVLRGHDQPVTAAGFSPDGARIVSGSFDNTVRVWDAASGKELLVLRGHEEGVLAAGFSPDGARIVSGSFDNTVRVWDAASGKELLVLRGHEVGVTAAGFSPDGARIVSGSYDNTVRVWDAASGKELLVLRDHEGGVLAAGFSPDGARIVSGSWDNTVRVWDAASGEELLVLRGHEGSVTAAGFSPDGARIVSGSGDHTVRVFLVPRTKQELIEIARARLPRELTEAEKQHFHVTAQ